MKKLSSLATTFVFFSKDLIEFMKTTHIRRKEQHKHKHIKLVKIKIKTRKGFKFKLIMYLTWKGLEMLVSWLSEEASVTQSVLPYSRQEDIYRYLDIYALICVRYWISHAVF